MQEDRQAAQAARGGSSRSGSGAGGAGGAADEELMAAQMNMTVPELQKFRNAQRTGDNSAYAVEQPQAAPATDEPQWSGAPAAPAAKALPPSFDSWLEQKRQQFATAGAEQHYGKDYDNVVKGRRGMQEIGASEAALRNPGQAGLIGKSMAVGEGKDIYGGNESGTYDKFTGEQTTGAVGQSKIRENDAQAGKARADAAKTSSPEGKSDQTFKSLELSLRQAGDDVETQRKALKDLKDTKGVRSADRPGHEAAIKSTQAALAKAMSRREALTGELDEYRAGKKGGSSSQPGEPGTPISAKDLPPLPGAAAAKPAAKPAAKSEAPKAVPLTKGMTRDQMVKGQIYQTPRGPARWNGSAFEQL